MTWLLATAFLAGFVAGAIDEQPAACAAFGVGAVYFIMRALCGKWLDESARFESTFPPPVRDRDESVEARASLPHDDSTRFEGKN